MPDTLVKVALVIFLGIPLIVSVVAFFIASTYMQVQDDIKQAEVKADEPRRYRRRVPCSAQASIRA